QTCALPICTAGDLALVFMSRGGVFLTGGIVQKILPALKAGNFRAAFEDKAPHSALMRTMPVYVITQPLAALAGLAAFARTPSLFGVETGGRRWRRPLASSFHRQPAPMPLRGPPDRGVRLRARPETVERAFEPDNRKAAGCQAERDRGGHPSHPGRERPRIYVVLCACRALPDSGRGDHSVYRVDHARRDRRDFLSP